MRRIVKLDHHRNGISGTPFWVAIIKEGGEKKLVIRLENMDKATGNVNCFVLDLEKLGREDIEFGSNSWRGEHYSEVMDNAIKKALGEEAEAISAGHYGK
jgi:hypothetical protein